jgi:soluble lytic murein transglycosylase
VWLSLVLALGFGAAALAEPAAGPRTGKPSASRKAPARKAPARKPAIPPVQRGPSADPRVVLHQLWAQGDRPALLAHVEKALQERPAQTRAWGYDYLRGRLLLDTGRLDEASNALTQALAAAPALTPWARLRLAQLHERAGRPAVAAGIAATLIGSRPARPLLRAAVDLLERNLADGGDCRLLAGLPPLAWLPVEQRILALARAECAWREQRRPQAIRELTLLLQAKIGDDPALVAADRLAERVELGALDGRTQLLIGSSFYEHRDFERALKFLAPAIAAQAGGYEAHYALARSLFWLENHAAAATAFENLARSTLLPEQRAQALYQQSRALELTATDPAREQQERERDFERAAEALAQILALGSDGRWADAAHVGLVRLDYLRGHEREAIARVDALVAARRLEPAGQTLLFLIASELSRGRTERVPAWLAAAGRTGGKGGRRLEIAYWQARLDELGQRTPVAIEHFLRLAIEAPYDPIGQAAMGRLRQRSLVDGAERRARQMARSASLGELAFAWRWLGDGDADGKAARATLVAMLGTDPRAIAFLRLTPKPPAEWPMWHLPLHSGEGMLAALGLFDELDAKIGRSFLTGDLAMTLAGSHGLTSAGAWYRGLNLGEGLGKRAPVTLALPLLPPQLLRAMYPLGDAALLDRETRRHQVDPTLLAAIIREESRFDPGAFSTASARGLTQFIVPTAQKLGARLQLAPLKPQDLHRPEISVALGAAYVAELSAIFGGHEAPTVAAYNAGAPQARLWRRYCYSDDPVEYLSKVGFKETRDYLTKVLTSRAHYREIYPPPAAPLPPPATAPG